jgi:hypothetical protein
MHLIIYLDGNLFHAVFLILLICVEAYLQKMKNLRIIEISIDVVVANFYLVFEGPCFHKVAIYGHVS